MLPIELTDLRHFDADLYERISFRPIESMRLMERTIETYLREC